MVTAEPEIVDVWIVGFDVPLAQATEGIAAVFGVDEERAAALVASVPRGVRRGLERGVASETVAALTSIGARVEVLPAGVRPSSIAPPPAAPGPRVTLKRAPKAAWLDEEPAYDAGSAAYIPPSPAEAVSDAHSTDEFFVGDLELGSLIPAALEAETDDLQLEFVPPRPVQDNAGTSRAMRAAGGAASLAAAQPGPSGAGMRDSLRDDADTGAARGGRGYLVVAVGSLVLLVGLLALRAAFEADPEAVAEAAPASGTRGGPSDVELLAACSQYQLEEARIWLRLGEANSFGRINAENSRALLARLLAAGATSASVAVESEASSRAAYLLLQHTPFHTEALVQAATSGASGAAASAGCVQVSPRYILIDFTCQ